MRNDTRIDQIMTRHPATVAPDDNLNTVKTIFENKGFHHVPVVKEGMLAGIVSYTDYLQIISEMHQGNTPEGQYQAGLDNIQVRDVMTQAVVTLRPGDTVEDAINLFKTHVFHALPVVEHDQRLVGILTTHDLVKVLEQVLVPSIDYAG